MILLNEILLLHYNIKKIFKPFKGILIILRRLKHSPKLDYKIDALDCKIFFHPTQ